MRGEVVEEERIKVGLMPLFFGRRDAGMNQVSLLHFAAICGVANFFFLTKLVLNY